MTGEGWYPRESVDDGEPYRWVKDGATLDVAQMPGLVYDVRLSLEPGPAVGLAPFVLAIYDEQRTPIARTRIDGRTAVTFTLPACDGRVRRLALEAEEAEEPVVASRDARTLKFRVFSIVATAVSSSPNAALDGLRRDVTARDGVIERLEGAAARLRMETEVAQRELAAKQIEIERYHTLAEERLAVIRALNDQHATSG